MVLLIEIHEKFIKIIMTEFFSRKEMEEKKEGGIMQLKRKDNKLKI